MNLSRPNYALGLRRAGGGSRKRARVQGAQIEPVVESIVERGQVAGRIFAEIKCMVAPTQVGFEVAKHGVDPLELGQVLRFAAADNGRQTTATLRDPS